MRIPVSKLRRPRLGRSVIDRTGLFQRAVSPVMSGTVSGGETDGGRSEPPVTLLSASAGTGKTTLMSSWANNRARRGARVAWLSLDRTDNDPRLFWSGVLAAVREATSPRPGDRGPAAADPLLSAGPREPAPQDRLELLVASSPRPLWLFLDDVQEIGDPQVLADLEALLRRLPEGLLLVLATRRDPAVALHRLRLAGRLREIRAADLALDREETRRLLAHHGVVLTEAELSVLVERTEGWAAGVRMAALTLAEAEDGPAIVQQFAGDDHAVADYLAAEILVRLGDRERRVLRLCAVPEQLTPDLAVAITGEDAAAGVLEQLYRDNVLVHRLAQPGGWYRMHTLLRSYLLAELRRTEPALLATAHRRTAHWFADHGAQEWAITHAVEAADDALALEMLTVHGPSLLAVGRGRALHSLIRSGSEELRGDPTVRRLDMLTLLEPVQVAAPVIPHPRQPARSRQEREPAGTPALGPLDALVELRLVRQDLGRSAAVLSASVDAARDRDDDLGLLLRLDRGMVALLAAHLYEAETELRAAQQLAEAAGNDHAQLQAVAGLTALASSRAHFRQTRELAGVTVGIALRSDALQSPEATGAILLAAFCARQRLDHAGARRLARRAASAMDGAVAADVQMSVRSLLAVLDIEAGTDPLDGARRLRDCWSLASGAAVPPLLAIHLGSLEHRCAWLAGRPDWAHESLVRLAEQIGPGGDLEVLTATEHLARGRLDAARHHVAAVLDGSSPCLWPLSRQQAWLVEASLAAHAGQRARSHEALRQALVLGEELGALRGFLDLPGITGLLDENVARFGRLEPLVERIRSTARRRPDHSFVPMTPKEFALLSDLPAQLTLEDIASSHQVSVNTVKTHVRSIYQKLGASSRRDAIASARRRGLL
jgi:LuxR family maltose regulon positive regulatory protein